MTFSILQLKQNEKYPNLRSWYTVLTIEVLPEEIDFTDCDVPNDVIQSYLESRFCHEGCYHKFKIKDDHSLVFDTTLALGAE